VVPQPCSMFFGSMFLVDLVTGADNSNCIVSMTPAVKFLAKLGRGFMN
jgi:hypothetical protein